MFKIFVKFKENVTEACRKSKKTFKRGFKDQAMKSQANKQLKKLKKVTPRSDRTTEHAADDWEIEYKKDFSGGIVGFECINPHDRIDYIEYGVERPKGGGRIYPKNKKALHFFIGGDEIFASSVKGSKIKEMGFVRKVQDEMIDEMPSWLKREFDRGIDKEWK